MPSLIEQISNTVGFDFAGLGSGGMVAICMILGYFFKKARKYTTPLCVLALVYCVLKLGFNIDLLESITPACS